MSDAAEISLARVTELCRARDVRLAYEIGAFVVFEACEAILREPRALHASDVWISPAGGTRVTGAPSVSSADAAGSVAQLLASVLVVAGQGVPGMLLHLVDVPHAQALGLAGYRDELEAALLPLNRSAARRVLSRQLRELARPEADGRSRDASASDEASAATADADLDALLGYEAPARPQAASATGAESDASHSSSTAPPEPARIGEALASNAAPLHGAAGATQRAPRDMPDETEHTTHEPAPSPPPSGRSPDLTGVVERDGAPWRAQLWLALAVSIAVAVGLYMWFQGPR